MHAKRPKKPRILFLESFYGGSHRDFADGLAEKSRYSIELVTLPARFWKWRMRGAALSFHQAISDPGDYDLVLATDLMGVADLKAMWSPACPPIVLYFHENQLSYPVPEGERLDYHFGFTNITSALAADRIVFNSAFHMQSFFEALPRFIGKMPEFKPLWTIEALRKKSSYLYPGCRFETEIPRPLKSHNRRPLIVWNHRWEFDKDPEAFFAALDEIDNRGIDFELALLGENFQMVPKSFLAAKERYGSRILVYGYVESRQEYYRWLSRGDVIISTAIQENYGISIIEGIRMGCYPLLPERLSYPEILPTRFHGGCIYKGPEDLVDRIDRLLSQGRYPGTAEMSMAMAQYGWERLVSGYDALFEELIPSRKGTG